ncbi:MAG TPA: TRAP transporter TatT component family protein [Candidatus Methylomirabilis sp.]|nr:TRAP transporter TatT component family protein [Candidatus Methylomirabilis sp.]
MAEGEDGEAEAAGVLGPAGARVDRGQRLLAAAPLVALAEAVAVKRQDLKAFESLLARALAIAPDAHPDTRLLNAIMQRRARRLLSQRAELFLSENE